MPDFNIVLTPGDVDAGSVNTVVEIPEGSRLKVESVSYTHLTLPTILRV